MDFHDQTQLRNQRGRLVKEMNEINDKAIDEHRDLSTEEQQKWDQIDSDITDLDLKIVVNPTPMQKKSNTFRAPDLAAKLKLNAARDHYGKVARGLPAVFSGWITRA